MPYHEKMPADPTAAGAREPGRPIEAHTAVSSLAAIGSVIAASSCCLPVLPFLMSAGLAGASSFLSAARPYLLGASVALIVYGFYQARRAARCDRKPHIIAPVLLWTSAAFVFVSLFFPQLMANAAASLLAKP